MKMSYSLTRRGNSIVIRIRSGTPGREFVANRALDIHDVMAYHYPWRYLLHVVRQMRWSMTAFIKEKERVPTRIE